MQGDVIEPVPHLMAVLTMAVLTVATLTVATLTLAVLTLQGDIIEPMLKPQWWLNCAGMAKRATDAVRQTS